jgi:hypothetical protein
VVVLAVQELIGWWKARPGVLTGEWKQHIPTEHGEPEKVDQVTCKHIGKNLSGHIKRIQPPDQTSKEWYFSGQIRGPLVFMTFWATDAATNPGSYGTIQLNMIDDNTFKGFYVKLIVTTKNERFTGQLRQCHLEWKRGT